VDEEQQLDVDDEDEDEDEDEGEAKVSGKKRQADVSEEAPSATRR
jgi:hypothetical protein